MALDFRASQFRGAKFIASGSTGTGASLIFYPIAADSTTNPNTGVINTAKFGTGSIGTDIFMFVSGGVGQKDSSNSHAVSVFGGDVHVSGNLTIGGTGGGATYWYATSSNVIFTTGSIDVTGSILLGAGTNSGNALYLNIKPPLVGGNDTSYSLIVNAGTPVVSGSGGAVTINGGDSAGDTKTKTGGAITVHAGDGSGLIYSDAAVNASAGGGVSVSAGDGGTALFNINGGAGGDVSINGGIGGDNFAQPGTGLRGGSGGGVYLEGGRGGDAGPNESDGYTGGPVRIQTGYGGDGAGGAGGAGGDSGNLTLITGDGGTADADFAGASGFVLIQAGTGGANNGASQSGDGGSVTLQAGNAGSNTGTGNAGNGGYINVGGGFGGGVQQGTPGDGGSLGLFAGDAGSIQNKASGAYATPGDVYLYPGAPSYDNSSQQNGVAGNVFIQGRAVNTASFNLSGSMLEIGGYVGTPQPYQNYGFRRIFFNVATSPLVSNGKFPGTDLFFYVSGTRDGIGTRSGSAAGFGGDVVISGNLYYNGNRKYTEFMPIGSYTSTTLTSSNPQVAGQAVVSQSEVPSGSIILRSVLSTTTGSVTASLRLFNINSGTYVHIGGPGTTTLNTVSTTPTQLQSVNLITATNFGTGANIYEVQVHIGTGSQQAILGSSMFVCT